MRDTSLAGPNRFPETTWGMISRLRDPARHRAALEDLCRRYWKPVYCYARIAWAKSNEDAKDLAQAFFAWLLEGEPLRSYAPERGGFRTFLKVLLKRFIGHQEVAKSRLKRGGGARAIPVETVEIADPRETDPEKLFDRAWVQELVTQAVERVRARVDATAFGVYELYEGGGVTYTDVAKKFGIPDKDVKKHLFAVREQVRNEIRAELAQLTSNERERDEEWNALFR